MPYTPMQLAEAYIQTGELQDALDALNQQLEANSADDEARRLRVQVLMRLRDDVNLRVALADLEQLTIPTVEDHVQKSIICERLGDLPSALDHIKDLWSLNSADDRLTERYLRLLVAQGELLKAIVTSMTLPRTWRWSQLRGDLRVLANVPETSIQHYSDALNLLAEQFNLDVDQWGRSIQARLLLARADAYVRLSKFLNQPEPAYNDFYKESISYKWIRDVVYGGEGYSVENTLTNADIDYLAAQSIIPTDPMIPFKRGLLALLRNDIQQAENLCRAAWTDANETLRGEMRLALQEDERYAPLAALLDTPTP